MPALLTDGTTNAKHQEVLYRFEAASGMLHDLPAHLGAAAVTSVESAANMSASAVGTVVGAVVPNIISRPVPIDASITEFEAAMADVEQTMRKFVVDAQINRGTAASDVELLLP